MAKGAPGAVCGGKYYIFPFILYLFLCPFSLFYVKYSLGTYDFFLVQHFELQFLYKRCYTVYYY